MAVVGVLIAGCAATTPPPPPDLSGTYVFSRAHYRGDAPMHAMPILPLRELQDESVVQVTVRPQAELQLEYTNQGGMACTSWVPLTDEARTYDTKRMAISWDAHRIVASTQPPRGVPIFPGLTRHSVRTTLYRDLEGCLVVEWSYREYGLALFLVPFIDAYSGEAILRPVVSPSPAVGACRSEAQWWVA